MVKHRDPPPYYDIFVTWPYCWARDIGPIFTRLSDHYVKPAKEKMNGYERDARDLIHQEPSILVCQNYSLLTDLPKYQMWWCQDESRWIIGWQYLDDRPPRIKAKPGHVAQYFSTINNLLHWDEQAAKNPVYEWRFDNHTWEIPE